MPLVFVAIAPFSPSVLIVSLFVFFFFLLFVVPPVFSQGIGGIVLQRLGRV